MFIFSVATNALVEFENNWFMFKTSEKLPAHLEFHKLFLDPRATSHMRLKVHDHCIYNLSLVEKVKTIQVHFTLEGERPNDPKKL